MLQTHGDPSETYRHIHHWLIQEASGPVSRGSCRSCKEEREFRNWLPELDFISRSERAMV